MARKKSENIDSTPIVKDPLAPQMIWDHIKNLTENKISYARQFYNDTVMTFNTAIEVFPASMIASQLGFKQRSYFEIDQAETEPVKVEF